VARGTRLPWVLVGGLLASLMAGGCAPPPPSEDAILYYLRNARVRGPVRRAWPAGQAYLDGLMRRAAVLRGHLAPLQALLNPESLWLASDPRWQERAAAEAEAKQLERLLLPGGEPQEVRRKAVADLQQAVAAVPDGLGLDDAARKAEFVAKVWAALGMDDPPVAAQVAELEATAQQRVALYRVVLSAADDLDAAQPGLRFKDSGRQAAVQAQYDAIQQRLSVERENWWTRAEETMIAAASALRTINKRERRWDYELLNNQKQYFGDELEAAAKQLVTLAEAGDAKARALEARRAQATGPEKTQVEVRLSGERQCAEELHARARVLRARLDEIKQRVAEAGRQS